jgi:hypothetical protein
LPPFYIFTSSAKLTENFRFKVSWLEGLPMVSERVCGPTKVESHSLHSLPERINE